MTTSTQVPEYRKLTGLGRGVGTFSQLAAGPDHLLHIISTGYTENYHRLYFRDIQSITLIYTGRRTNYNLILLLFWVLGCAFALMADAPFAVYITIALLLLPFVIWNSVLGPGCRTEIVTAVRREKIPSLNRLVRTHRVLAGLGPAISAAQRDFTMPLPVAAETGPPVLPGDVLSAASAAHIPPPLPLPPA